MQKSADAESSHWPLGYFYEDYRVSSKRSMTLLRTTKKKNLGFIDPARSALMARVRQKHSAPEIEVRRLLRDLGASYRLHPKSLPGTPDIIVTEAKCAVFVHGCFWHRHPSCSKATMPKTRVGFWTDKFAKNVARDARKARDLRAMGWKVLTVWECQCSKPEILKNRLRRLLAK
jgi:DNA mismatch endonuclease (patch repair protein)